MSETRPVTSAHREGALIATTAKSQKPSEGICPPGSNPHADRPNWQPADSITDYLWNCREGLENFSERRVCQLLGWSRAKLWRVRQIAKIPEGLFEHLFDEFREGRFRLSEKKLAAIGQALE